MFLQEDEQEEFQAMEVSGDQSSPLDETEKVEQNVQNRTHVLFVPFYNSTFFCYPFHLIRTSQVHKSLQETALQVKRTWKETKQMWNLTREIQITRNRNSTFLEGHIRTREVVEVGGEGVIQMAVVVVGLEVGVAEVTRMAKANSIMTPGITLETTITTLGGEVAAGPVVQLCTTTAIVMA